MQYNIKKREEIQEITQEEPNPLMRKKKTPEELAAEAEAEEQDEFTSKYLKTLNKTGKKKKFNHEIFFRIKTNTGNTRYRDKITTREQM